MQTLSVGVIVMMHLRVNTPTSSGPGVRGSGWAGQVRQEEEDHQIVLLKALMATVMVLAAAEGSAARAVAAVNPPRGGSHDMLEPPPAGAMSVHLTAPPVPSRMSTVTVVALVLLMDTAVT